MLDFSWRSWGGSVIGPLHVKAGTPNQDSWMARRFKWGNVVVVSDGLGSKAHSDHGSKVACLAVIQAAKTCQSIPSARIADILRLIHANWLLKIAPYSPSDCSATCLFAIQAKEIVTLGRLGDGMIVALGDSMGGSIILSDYKQNSFSNYTDSLQQEFKAAQWEIATVDAADCSSVVLCTDGISDDLLPQKRMEFARELSSTYASVASGKRNRDLKRWLNRWPVPGHTDDKTIACLYKDGRPI